MSILDKTRAKLGGAIDAATDKLDDLTGGKTVMLSARVDAVAHKIAGDAPAHDPAGEPARLDDIDDDTLYDDGLDADVFVTEPDGEDNGTPRISANLD